MSSKQRQELIGFHSFFRFHHFTNFRLHHFPSEYRTDWSRLRRSIRRVNGEKNAKFKLDAIKAQTG